jgi:exopolysaccharide production protein ExoQ
MPPHIATLVFLAGILSLFLLDRDVRHKTSWALWIPAAWIFIGASRMVSQWFGGSLSLDNPDQYLEGSPLDRAILTGLLVASLIVLVVRAGRTVAFCRRNPLAVLFFLYCLASVLWSDYPLTAFKRWTKGLGNLAMVIVIVTDPSPALAIRRVFARIGFWLVPVSVLLIKYYPDLGRAYSRWTWEPHYTGAATEKNALGCIALLFGLASFWRLVEALRTKSPSTDAPSRMGQIIAHGTIVSMALWLFGMADSSTSFACFILGAALIILLTVGGRRPAVVHAAVACIACLAVAAFTFQGAYESVVQSLGRDTTLTGRTEIWDELFRMDFNRFVGTGFESFWLGERAAYFWDKYYFHPNQAHNGYIEMYINLGWVGEVFLVLLIVAGYRRVVEGFRLRSESSTLMLALFAVALLYNVTEASFKVMHPIWIAFLLAITAGSSEVLQVRGATSTNDAAEWSLKCGGVSRAPAIASPWVPPPRASALVGRSDAK